MMDKVGAAGRGDLGTDEARPGDTDGPGGWDRATVMTVQSGAGVTEGQDWAEGRAEGEEMKSDVWPRWSRRNEGDR